MFAPLAVGTYTLHFEGAFVFSTEEGDEFDSVFELDITYEMNVVPQGQYQAP